MGVQKLSDHNPMPNLTVTCWMGGDAVRSASLPAQQTENTPNARPAKMTPNISLGFSN
jgi:hypothetical protein